MFAMLIGLMTGVMMAVFLAVYIFFQIICMFVPGLIARFLVKRRMLTLDERKKFRRIYSMVFISLWIPLIITELVLGRNEDFFVLDFIGTILSMIVELGINLFVNSMILKKQ